jgi:hypothetical protein
LYPGDIWFLKEYTEEGVTNEDGTHLKQHVVVTDAWFNRDIPADVFTYEGIGVLPGTPISTYDDLKAADQRYLGENKVAPANVRVAAFERPATPVEPVPGTVNYWLVAACGLLAVLSAGLLFRFYKSRSS